MDPVWILSFNTTVIVQRDSKDLIVKVDAYIYIRYQTSW